MMDVYSDAVPVSSQKRVTHGDLDTEKISFLMPHFCFKQVLVSHRIPFITIFLYDGCLQ